MEVIVISDIHLRAYHRYNKFPDQRLKSFLLLAEDVVELGKEKNITTLIITGDIIDKSTLTPREIHVLFKMFDILASQFKVYSIVGNHDMKLKKGDFERDDSIVTLLEEIDNVFFLHQDILKLNGRTLAFENWVPEFDLSWIEEPVDLYFSHATIDYDDTGFYGMDTSVFDGKFKLGFFGDIHVRRERGNLISVGNTKQESFSDRYQGGGIILNLDDLSWERFDIDPNHTKYLWLVTTEDLEEEGWVDLEGDDMTYRVYKQKKVEGKTFDFVLPESTDIESKLESVMKDLDLLSLHKSIKARTNYQPIDFNFKLDKLVVEHFRSIKNYTLDFDQDYVITGPNGSGKSTLITALFYALIGKKTLKQEITFGEKSCTLRVVLTYQKQTFDITRGTGSGDYGLVINGETQKYNNKAEFEKDVLEHLPFLDYHESFFFNYWDTEMLGTLKVDKRYDLISKYFRLDALSEYNDVGVEDLRLAKKVLKEKKDELLKLSIQVKGKEDQVTYLTTQLENKDSKEVLTQLMEDYKTRKTLNLSINSLEVKINELKSKSDKYKSELDNVERKCSDIEISLKGSKSKEITELSLSSYEQRTELNKRFDKGTSMKSMEETSLLKIKAEIDKWKEIYSLMNPGSLKDIPVNLESEIQSIKSLIEESDQSLRSSVTESTYALNTLLEKIKSVEKELQGIEKVTLCNGCGKPMSNEEKISYLNDRLKSLSLEKVSLELDNKQSLSDLEKWKSRKSDLEDNRFKLSRELLDIKEHNLKVENARIELKDLNVKILSLENECLGIQNKIGNYTEVLEEIEIKIHSLPEISSEENTLNSILLDTWNRFESANREKDIAFKNYEESKSEYLDSYQTLFTERESLIKTVSELNEVTEDENLDAALTIATYNNLEVVSNEFKIQMKEYTEKELEITDELEVDFNKLEIYCQLTSRSGDVLKDTLDELTNTFSNSQFRFSTNRAQANGKVVTDMSIEYLVGKNWVKYPALSSGQKTLCDLYFISKIVTGVGIVSFDETLRFLDDDNMKIASDIIVDIKKQNLIISSHSPNLYVDGVSVLKCELDVNSHTSIEIC